MRFVFSASNGVCLEEGLSGSGRKCERAWELAGAPAAGAQAFMGALSCGSHSAAWPSVPRLCSGVSGPQVEEPLLPRCALKSQEPGALGPILLMLAMGETFSCRICHSWVEQGFPVERALGSWCQHCWNRSHNWILSGLHQSRQPSLHLEDPCCSPWGLVCDPPSRKAWLGPGPGPLPRQAQWLQGATWEAGLSGFYSCAGCGSLEAECPVSIPVSPAWALVGHIAGRGITWAGCGDS